MRPANVLAAINQHIFDFVHEPANRRLRPGTGSYSTPFRGTLFGLAEGRAVAQQLETRGVDVLWLGTNPNVPRSLEHILNPRLGDGDFPDFERQVGSGLFAHRDWESPGERPACWNPIQDPRGGWIVYRDLLAKVANLERVTMANFIPWGSRSARQLLDGLGAADSALLKRAIGFADELNVEIVGALKPSLMVVPLSLGRMRQLDAVMCTGVAMQQTDDVRHHHVTLDGRRVNFYTGICRRGSHDVPTLHVPHPASLRLSVGSKHHLTDELSQAVVDLRLSA